MNRREFLTKTAAASLILTPALASFLASCRPAGFPGNDPVKESELAAVSDALQDKINNLFGWLKEKGWLDHIKGLGLELPADGTLSSLISAIDEETLRKLKATSGFEDFGGNKFIEPGYPAFSLLYHILANPRVRPAGFHADQYPDLVQTDVLEDYIYALLTWDDYKKAKHYDLKEGEELVLAVFAYEYRTAFKTPHHQYADMVFSRTGIGRVGNKPYLYDRQNRCYTNNPSGNPGDKGIAVAPARYGLFIAKKIPYTHKNLSAMEMDRDKTGDGHYLKHDSTSEILLPIRKLFNDDTLTDSQPIRFSEYHESKKTARLLKDERYTRKSEHLVNTVNLNSSYLVCSQPEKLIKPLLDERGHLKTFTALAKTSNGQNRYFTAYFNDEIVSQVEDIEILDSTGTKRYPNDYESPRNSPMYVHLAHRAMNDTSVVYHDRFGRPDFEKEMNGERTVPLFEDKLCDGYISASLNLPGGNALKVFADRGVLNAFSIMTAPDFFPQVDDFDFQEFDIAPGSGSSSLFYEGGIASLATCNVPPNPFVYKNDPETVTSSNPKETYTAVISRKRLPEEKAMENVPADHFRGPDKSKGYFFSSYLPDMCSSVFAPGWDVTYSGEKGQVFLSTQGLGSPFVEDMKLCAAMNGMWPAASPDASRTFQGSVTVDQYQNEEWERNPTAVPLMDDGIGFHQTSPAVKEQGLPVSYGWDGEQGPFLEALKEKGKSQWHVNFTDLGRADYVENTLMNTLDMSKLRALDSCEVHARMCCLRNCLRVLDSRYIPNGINSLWLVSAEKAKWGASVQGYGIPEDLLTASKTWATSPRKGISGEGFLFVFVKYTPDADLAAIHWVEEQGRTKRRRVRCETVYVCQVTAQHTAYYKIDMQANDPYNESNWKFANT